MSADRRGEALQGHQAVASGYAEFDNRDGFDAQTTGGVGSIGIQCLSKLGYKVTALTRKDSEQAYLKELGASEVLLLPSVSVPSVTDNVT